MKKYLITALLSAFGMSAFAQAEFDALRLSQTDITGTARFVAMSGAFGALGGDMSAISLNPAGIGVYRSSEFSISPAFQQDISISDLDKQTAETSKMNVLMNGFGYVGSFRTYDESAISNFNFGITYNRVADFNRNTKVVGVGRRTSLLDRISKVENDLWNVGHTDFYNYVSGIHVIGLNTAGNAYVSPLTDNELTNSNMELQESGGINSWNFTLGANYNHSLYIGIGLGIQSIVYDRASIYSEDYEFGGGTELRNVLTTTGSGIDFKAGIIYRPVPELRLGFSYRTGTFYKLTDVFNSSMASYGFLNPVTDEVYNPDPKVIGDETYVDYMLRTPWQLTLSAAYQFGNKGLLSMDIDWIDSRSMNMKSGDGFEMDNINYYLENDFKTSCNIRIGGEMRLTDNFSARMGAAYYMSPLVANLETMDIATAYTRPEYSMVKSTMYASMGVGYRSGAFFTDVAVQERLSNENFFNYCDLSKDSQSNYATLTRDKVNLVITAGFKF